MQSKFPLSRLICWHWITTYLMSGISVCLVASDFASVPWTFLDIFELMKHWSVTFRYVKEVQLFHIRVGDVKILRLLLRRLLDYRWRSRNFYVISNVNDMILNISRLWNAFKVPAVIIGWHTVTTRSMTYCHRTTNIWQYPPQIRVQNNFKCIKSSSNNSSCV